MLQVDLENILTEEDALQKISDIFSHVENQKEIYVVTSGGRPTVVIMSIEQLEKMGGVNAVPEPEAPAMPMDSTPPPATPTPAPIAPELALPEMPSTPSVDMSMTEPAPAEPAAPTMPAAPAPEAAAPAATTPAMPGMNPGQAFSTPPSNLPPMSGNLDIPAAPEDPRNSSPLA